MIRKLQSPSKQRARILCDVILACSHPSTVAIRILRGLRLQNGAQTLDFSQVLLVKKQQSLVLLLAVA